MISTKVKTNQIQTPEINDAIYQAPTEDRLISLSNDIRINGLINPIRVSKDLFIYDGNTRFKAIKLLGYDEIEVIINEDLLSNTEEFSRLIISANNQRVKSSKDLLREIQVSINPLEYEKRKLILNGDFVDLDSITGSLKADRNISSIKDDLIKSIIDIIVDYQEYLPLTVRAIHYILLDKNVLTNNKKKDSVYKNDRSSYSGLSNLLTKLRINKIIKYEWIRDDGRTLYKNRGFDSAERYIDYEVDKMFTNYYRDIQQTQEAYNIIFCEKETLRPILEKLTRKYGIPIAFIKGGSSLTIRYNFIKDWEHSGSKKIINAMVLSDFDPAGYRIKDTLIGSIESDFMKELEGVKLNAYHIGITQKQITKYNLYSDLDAKESDKNFIDFVKVTGSLKAYELDALKPNQLLNEVEEAIQNCIDMELINDEIIKYNDDLDIIETMRKKFQMVLSS
jgi:hypothetical protein